MQNNAPKVDLLTKFLSYFFFIVFIIFSKHFIYDFLYFISLIILLKLFGYKIRALIKFIFNFVLVGLIIFLLLYLFTTFILAGKFIIVYLVTLIYIYIISYNISKIELRKYFLWFLSPLEKLKINVSTLSEKVTIFMLIFNEYINTKKVVLRKLKNYNIKLNKFRIFNVTMKEIKNNNIKEDKIKDFMLFDRKKKYKKRKIKLSIKDVIFILFDIIFLIILLSGEKVYYAIFIKFQIFWNLFSWL